MIEDINLCNEMVKKRDEIIKTQNEALDNLRDQGNNGDYEELVLQLKAATGEITRLEAQHEVDKGIILDKKASLGVIAHERDELAETVKTLQSQLDQECNSNAELEDNNDADYKEVCRLLDVETKKLLKAVEEKSLLEEKLANVHSNHDKIVKAYCDDEALLKEKLALCGEYYKFERERNVKIIDALIALEHEMKIMVGEHELE